MLTAVNEDGTPMVTDGSLRRVVVGGYQKSLTFLYPSFRPQGLLAPTLDMLPLMIERLPETAKWADGRREPSTLRQYRPDRARSDREGVSSGGGERHETRGHPSACGSRTEDLEDSPPEGQEAEESNDEFGRLSKEPMEQERPTALPTVWEFMERSWRPS
jgi:hypothetical protein